MFNSFSGGITNQRAIIATHITHNRFIETIATNTH